MVIETGKRVLKIESEAVAALANRLDESFLRAVEALDNCRGRVIISGMGKSGLIGKKISNSRNQQRNDFLCFILKFFQEIGKKMVAGMIKEMEDKGKMPCF